MKRNNNRGFSIIVVMLALTALAIFGFAYFFTSQNRVINAIIEADKIRARNIARAGFEKAKLLLKKEYLKGNYDFYYPGNQSLAVDEFKHEFEIGKFEIMSMEIVKSVETDENKIMKTYKNNDYLIDNVYFGKYDIFKVVVDAEITASKTKVSIEGFVKVIKQEIAYR